MSASGEPGILSAAIKIYLYTQDRTLSIKYRVWSFALFSGGGETKEAGTEADGTKSAPECIYNVYNLCAI